MLADVGFHYSDVDQPLKENAINMEYTVIVETGIPVNYRVNFAPGHEI